MDTDALKANDVQVGGAHYKKQKFQHWDYCIARDGPAYLEHMLIKYVSRWKDKGGVQDLEKAKHFLQKLIEWALTNPNDYASPADNKKLQEFLDGLSPWTGAIERDIIIKVAEWRNEESPLLLHQAHVALTTLIHFNTPQEA